MPCENGRKYFLGDYGRGVLAETEAAPVREHLKDCPDCRQDLAQFERLLPLLAHFAKEHIPADSLIDYYHQSREGPAWSKEGFWNAEMVEKHLSICDHCKELFDRLTLAEKEFQEISKERALKPSIEKGFLKRWIFLGSRRVLYAAVAATALLLWLVPNLPLRSQGPMLAVLPFEYLGPAEKDYYAVGIPNDVTERLTKVSGLNVISPASTIRYMNTAKKPGQIGAELGVDYLLTGQIFWDTTGKTAKLRVAPRLVRTKDQKQLWAESLDFVWGELCALPGVLSRKAVAALNVASLETERQAMEACPTGNIEAYEYYLHGLKYADRWEFTRQAAEMFEKAVQTDSSFALGFGRLALARIVQYILFARTEECLLQAKRACDKALELKPNLPEAQLALGAWMLCIGDERAKEAFAQAERGASNNSEVLFLTGCAHELLGDFDRALDLVKKAAKLDPLSAKVSAQLAEIYGVLRRYKEAERELARGLSHNPDWSAFYSLKANLLCVSGEGNITKARKVLEEAAGKIDSASLAPIWAQFEFLTGNYAKALAHLPRSFEYHLMVGKIYYAMNQKQLARVYFDSMRVILEPLVRITERPLHDYKHRGLGVVYAGLGRTEEAIREGKKAVELTSRSKNVGWSLTNVKALAEIYMMVGEYDLAIDQLEYLLSIPCDVTVPYLRIDATWAPLRSHPRFQKLINERV